VHAVGTEKRMEIEIPFNAPLGGATRLFVDDGKAHGNAGAITESFAPCNMYTLQGDAFSRVVRGETPLPYGVEDAICNLRVIDALFASEKTGGWVTVG
jgi:predicted dehydrogenase